MVVVKFPRKTNIYQRHVLVSFLRKRHRNTRTVIHFAITHLATDDGKPSRVLMVHLPSLLMLVQINENSAIDHLNIFLVETTFRQQS